MHEIFHNQIKLNSIGDESLAIIRINNSIFGWCGRKRYRLYLISDLCQYTNLFSLLFCFYIAFQTFFMPKKKPKLFTFMDTYKKVIELNLIYFLQSIFFLIHVPKETCFKINKFYPYTKLLMHYYII